MRPRGTTSSAGRISGFSIWPGGWTNWQADPRGRCGSGCGSPADSDRDALAARLESLSPLAVLGRGYSLTQRTADGRVIRDAAELAAGEQLTTRFAQGQAVSRVERVEP